MSAGSTRVPAGNARRQGEVRAPTAAETRKLYAAAKARDSEHQAAAELGRRHAAAGRDRTPPFDAELGPAYEGGYDEGSRRRSTRDTSRSAGGRNGAHGARGAKGSAGAKGAAGAKSGTGAKRSPSRTSRRVARRPGTRAYRRAARQISRPASDQLANGMYVIGLTIAVALLFNAIENAAAVGRVIGAAGGAVTWLSDPTRSIPYKK